MSTVRRLDRSVASLIGRFRSADANSFDADQLDLAIRHGVGPLVYHAIDRAKCLEAVAPVIRRALLRLAREAILAEAVRQRQLRFVLQALKAHDVEVLVFKGSAIAYTHYPLPWLRPRTDTDLLVRRSDADRATDVLEHLGLVRVPRPSGQAVTQQASFVAKNGFVAYDLHWRLADPHAFAAVLPYEALAANARRVSMIGALVPDDMHALLIACVHRAAHHHDADTLILLYDIDLLSRSLDDEAWIRFEHLASRYHVRAVCRRGLALTVERFGSPVPGHVWRVLDVRAEDEVTGAFACSAMRPVDILSSDLRSLPGWRARTALIAQHLFPSPEYMCSKYGRHSGLLLPAFYLHRAATGAMRWFRHE